MFHRTLAEGNERGIGEINRGCIYICTHSAHTRKKEIKRFPRVELYSLTEDKGKQTISTIALETVHAAKAANAGLFTNPTRPEFLMLLYLDARVVCHSLWLAMHGVG